MHTTIGYLLQQVLPQNHRWQVVLLQQWDSIVGNLKTHIRLEKIHNETLIIGVTNTAWMQEMYLLSDLLLNKINITLDQPRIKQLRFRYAPPITYKKKLRHVCLSKVTIPNVLSYSEKRALEQIKDSSLQSALEQFLVRCRSKDSYDACHCSSPSLSAPSFPYK